MKESLVCTICEQTWKRERTRGRKPTSCPSCSSLSTDPVSEPIKKKSRTNIKKEPKVSVEKKVNLKTETPIKSNLTVSKVVSVLHPRPKVAEELQESTKNGSQWICPGCKHVITLYVAITDIPTHRCTPDMVSVKICERLS